MGLKDQPHGREYCDAQGKVKLTKGQAKSLAKRTRGIRPEAYKCRTCGKWHVGNRRPGLHVGEKPRRPPGLLESEDPTTPEGGGV